MTVKIRTEHTKQRKWQIFYTKISVSIVEGGLDFGTVCGCVLNCLSHVRLFPTLWTVARQAPLSIGFSKKETGVGCHTLIQGIFPTHGSNLGLLHCRQIFLLSEPPEAILPLGNICRTVQIILRKLSLC